MNIGNTPQEQLDYIRKVHKWTNIIGLGLIGFYFIVFAIGIISKEIKIDSSSLESLPLITVVIIIAVPFVFCAIRVYAWGFFWVKSKFTKTAVAGIAAVTANTLASGSTYNVYRDSISGDVTITKKTNWLPVVLIAVVFFYVIVFIGLFYAIKHTVLEFRLKKQFHSSNI